MQAVYCKHIGKPHPGARRAELTRAQRPRSVSVTWVSYSPVVDRWARPAESAGVWPGMRHLPARFTCCIVADRRAAGPAGCRPPCASLPEDRATRRLSRVTTTVY